MSESSELSDISLSEPEDIVEDHKVEEDPEEDDDEELDEEDDFEDSADEYKERETPKPRYNSRVVLRVGNDSKRLAVAQTEPGKQKFISDDSENSSPVAAMSMDTAEMDEEDEEDDEQSLDSEDAMPDFSRMTARQRARYASDAPPEGSLLELPPEPIKRKVFLTVEEQQLKRAELARRRKNLSERRLEEEKQDTLDKLLKKRAPKSRRNNEDDSGVDEDAPVVEKKSRLVPIHPAMHRWSSSKTGFTLSFTEERAVNVGI